MREATLVETARAELGEAIAGQSDDEIIAVGHSVCLALESGVKPAEIEDQFTRNGFAQIVAANMIIGSATVLCDDQLPKVANGW